MPKLMKNKIILVLIHLILVFNSCSPKKTFDSQCIIAGDYGGLLLSKDDSSKIVSFVLQYELANKDKCETLGIGRYNDFINDSTLKVTLFTDLGELDTMKATISFGLEGIFYLKTKHFIPVCFRVVNTTDDVASFFFLEKKNNYGLFSCIYSEKSFLYKTTSEKAKTSMYLINGDIVEIIETRTNWAKIKYLKNESIVYWIKKSDLLMYANKFY